MRRCSTCKPRATPMRQLSRPIRSSTSRLFARTVGHLFLAFEVEGISMWPSVRPGETVLCRRTRSLRAGDIVVVSVVSDLSSWADQNDHGIAFMVKRVLDAHADGFDVRGDNASKSLDSRQLGVCPVESIVGVCLWVH